MQPVVRHNSSNSTSAAHAEALSGASMRQKPRLTRKFKRFLQNLTFNQVIKSRSFQVSAAAIFVLAAGSMTVQQNRFPEDSMFASVSSMLGFEASKLVVNGNKNVNLDVLKGQLASQLGGSLFSFDVGEARENVLQSPWVKYATIRKVYPDTIMVDLVERAPVALWKAKGRVNIISPDGSVIEEAGIKFMHLPQVVGQGANKNAAEFLSTITKFPELTRNAAAYVRIGKRRWNIRMNNGPRIMLPEKDWKSALVELNNLQKKKQILERDLVQLDMRLPDRLVIKLSPEAAMVRKTTIEEALKRDWHKI